MRCWAGCGLGMLQRGCLVPVHVCMVWVLFACYDLCLRAAAVCQQLGAGLVVAQLSAALRRYCQLAAWFPPVQLYRRLPRHWRLRSVDPAILQTLPLSGCAVATGCGAWFLCHYSQSCQCCAVLSYALLVVVVVPQPAHHRPGKAAAVLLPPLQCRLSRRRLHTAGTFCCRGVFWDRKNSRWRAQVGFNNRKIFMGYFGEPAEAARAYDKKVVQLHGALGELKVQPGGRGGREGGGLEGEWTTMES